jgi:GNAT superfamily N-acetyltransferase
MKIIDLTENHKPLYFKCLIGDEKRLDDAGDIKSGWYEKMKHRGLKVKLAIDESDQPIGMIQYLPIEESFAMGKELYLLYCIWVINDTKFRGNHQKQGYGSALLSAFEHDAKQSGKKGVAVWGISIPAFMRARWFAKHGYEVADKDGIRVLMWKHWEDTEKPSWIRPKLSNQSGISKDTITCFKNGWCPEVNKAFNRVNKAIEETKCSLKYNEIDTTERTVYDGCGMTDAIFIGEKEIPLGPAPSYKKILKEVKRAEKKFKAKK